MEETLEPKITAPPFHLHRSPSMTRSPLIIHGTPRTPLSKSPFARRSTTSTPTASPLKRAVEDVKDYLGEVGRFTRLDPQEDWLPITESRNGNAYYAAFHALSSGIGVQALVLPLAFTTLGWIWGSVCLSSVFIWQLYTLWLLIQLHELDNGKRYSRYLKLSMAAFGERKGKILALFPTMYLSGGTCVTFIIIGGSTMKLFFRLVCPEDTCSITPLSTIEWYLVFTCCAVILAQLPNLNSIAGISLVGAITGVAYCTLVWVLSIAGGRIAGASHEPVKASSEVATLCDTLNAVGIVAFAFRGHNLVLEIQGTMPSTGEKPSRIPMWKGVKFAYAVIAMCLFPLAAGGYWTYGDLMPANGGMLNALYKYRGHGRSKVMLGLTSLLVVISSLSSFQIYAMPVFDNLEFRYTCKKQKPCPRWLRTSLRIFFGCLAFFISVALPFLPSLAGLLGGITLPITLVYPSLMWILMKKPEKFSIVWCINGVLAVCGVVLSILIVVGATFNIVKVGLEANFFRPR